MKNRLLNLVLGIVALFGATSCIQNHTVVIVNKDGSATIEESTMLGGMVAQMMAGLGDAFGQEGGEGKPASSNPLMDRASYEARAKKLGEGVTLTKMEETKDAKGGIGVNVVYTVKDINKLKLNMNAEIPESLKGMAPGVDETIENAKKDDAMPPISFGFKAGELTINVPQPKADADANNELEGLEPELNLGPEERQQMEMAKMMLQDMAMSLKVKVNGEIKKTNASHHAGNEITLFSMKFSEVLKDPDAFSKLAMMGEDMKNPDKAMEAMKAMPGVKFESQKKVTTTIK